jgi:phosphatidylethanolamine-binding protein (PEBP) family uncharacterized protein
MSGRKIISLVPAHRFALLALIATIGVTGCATTSAPKFPAVYSRQPTQASASAVSPGQTSKTHGFTLTSSAFANGADIPEKYTCMGDSVSPPLAWDGAPPQTTEFALIMEESHPGFSVTLTHWVALHINGSTAGSLIENAARTKGALEQVVPYESPCPYSDYRNGYSFTLYALSGPLPTNGDTIQEDILAGSLAKTTLTGWYEIN